MRRTVRRPPLSRCGPRGPLGLVLLAALSMSAAASEPTTSEPTTSESTTSEPTTAEPTTADGDAVARGHDPWVFRCVLDGCPRSVVAALAPRLWVAYDPATGGIARVFDGGVEFVGSVYDGAHGPQPKSRGAVLVGPVGPRAWSWLRAAKASGDTFGDGDRRVPYRRRFLGYRVDGNRLRILRRLEAVFDDREASVHIEESPEAVRARRRAGSSGGAGASESRVRLERRFRIEGLPAGDELVVDLGLPGRGSGARMASGPSSCEVVSGRHLRLRGPGGSFEVTVVHDREGVR